MSSMDLVAIARSYVERTLREVKGMKVLILDAETMRTVSTIFTQSEILKEEVYLVERLDGQNRTQQVLPHVKAIAILRPSRENIALLRAELRDPKYGAYHLCKLCYVLLQIVFCMCGVCVLIIHVNTLLFFVRQILPIESKICDFKTLLKGISRSWWRASMRYLVIL